VDDNAPIWSPAIKQAIEDWYTAKHDHDEDGQKNAARDMINATAAYHKAGGVPLFAHRPLPPQFVDAEIGNVQKLPEGQSGRIIDAFVDKFDVSAKPIVAQQVAATLKNPTAGNNTGAGSPDEPMKSSPTLTLPQERSSPVVNSTMLQPAPDDRGIFASAQGGRPTKPTRTPEQVADDLDKNDPVAWVAHPFAYAADLVMNDVAGENGWLGDWGKRHVIPRPNDARGAVGEFLRDVIESGPGVVGASMLARGAFRNKVMQLSREALISGALSAAAEWITHRDVPPGQEPNFVVAFLTGAASPYATNWLGKYKKYKYVSDMALAMAGSIATDYIDGKQISITRAIGAGLAAALLSGAGDSTDPQALARMTRKAFQKVGKDVLKEFFGDVAEFSEKEWDEIVQGFQSYQRFRQQQRNDQGGTFPL
jgi:hypothetical protein